MYLSTCLNPDCFWTVSDIFLFSISILSCKHKTFSQSLEITECMSVCPLSFQDLFKMNDLKINGCMSLHKYKLSQDLVNSLTDR